MVRKVSVRGNKVTIDWDQEDYDFFFRFGLQLLADEHFKGERKVVVLPADAVKLEKKAKSIEVSDEFADACVGKGVNQALRDHLGKIDAEKSAKTLGERHFRKGWGSFPPGSREPAGLPSFVPRIGGPDVLVHKAIDIGEPESICGVKMARNTAIEWDQVNCPKCRKVARGRMGKD
jgi:hypothetical protein